MKKRILQIFLIFLVLFSSCVKKTPVGYLKGKQADYLTGGNYKYWLLLDNNSEEAIELFFFYFDKKGNSLRFVKYYKSAFEESYGGDCPVNEYWYMVNDSVVNISGLDEKIIHLDDKLFIFKDSDKDSYDKKNYRLISVPYELIPMKYRKLISRSKQWWWDTLPVRQKDPDMFR